MEELKAITVAHLHGSSDTMFTAPSGKEPIDAKGAWTKIGDCEISYARGISDPFIYEFAIRPTK